MSASRAQTAAKLLRERARAEREADEERARVTRSRVEAVIASHLPVGATAWLIGSLAWGGFGPQSDVDLVVRGLDSNQALELERAVIEASGCLVELIDFETVPASFRERVEQEGLRFDGR